MIRKFGLACNSIVAAELVTADGRRVRTDRDTEGSHSSRSTLLPACR